MIVPTSATDSDIAALARHHLPVKAHREIAAVLERLGIKLGTARYPRALAGLQREFLNNMPGPRRSRKGG